MSLSDYFTLEELVHSDYAVRNGIDNTPSHEVFERLKVLAHGLERVRSVLAVPMRINSGYRSPKLNAALKGSRTSDHMLGLAADFTAPRFGTPLEVCREIEKYATEIAFKQLIQEGTWIHISFPDVDQVAKLEVLTAHFGNGGVTYTRGLA